MDRLYTKLEITALRTISSGEKIADWLYPRLRREHFSLESSQEFFRRIRILTHKSGRLPDWDDLLADITISEETREVMEDAPDSIITSRRDAAKVIARLEEYRQARVAMDISRTIAKTLKETKVDVPVLLERVADKLAMARSASDWSESTITFGGKEIDKSGIRRVIRERTFDFIPTGFKAFDTVNLGVPKASVFVLAGETGAGKSTLASAMAVNMARYGACVGLTSLEMEDDECGQRVLANLSGVDLSTIQRLKENDTNLIKQLQLAWLKFHKQVANNGGRFEIVSPPEDVSIEELLTRNRGRGFDVHIIDYLSLLKGMDEEDQWRKLSAAARYAKVYTKTDKSIVILLAQLSEEGRIRYSRGVQEHATLMWAWNKADAAGIITIKQPKARNQKQFDFYMHLDSPRMRLLDVDMSKIEDRGEERTKKVEGRKHHRRLPPPRKDPPRSRDDTEKEFQL
jgi:replicative DNA helicase